MNPLPDAAQTALEQFNQAAGWEQRARLLEIADKCPVHRTLESTSRIATVVRSG